MKELGLTTTTLAKGMHTSRNQIHRILDQGDAGMTLKMLFRLGEALGVPVTVGRGAPRAACRQAPRKGARSVPSQRRSARACETRV